MESLVHGERDIPFALLLIVRARWSGLSLSATLFRTEAESSAVDVYGD